MNKENASKLWKMIQEAGDYLQDQYDFVEIIDAPGSESVLGFTIWYSRIGFGSIQTLPAFGDQTIRNIIKEDK